MSVVLNLCHRRLFTQLLPTLDIYTWTEEHVVGFNLSPLVRFSFRSRPVDSTDLLPFVCLFYFLSISGCSRYLAQVGSFLFFKSIWFPVEHPYISQTRPISRKQNIEPFVHSLLLFLFKCDEHRGAPVEREAQTVERAGN